MRIVPSQSTSVSSIKKNRKSTGSSAVAFSSLLDADASESSGASAPVRDPQPLGMMDSMLLLQEVSEEELHKKQAVKHGRMTLGALEKLRDGLLMGHISEQLILDIQRLVDTQRHSTNSPQLNQVLDEIELRAAVEIAKLEQRQQRAY